MKQFLMVLGFFMLASGSLVFAQDNPCGVEGVVVEASSTQYAPSNVEVEIGETVVWVNVQGTHDVNGVDSSTGAAWNNPETFALGAVIGNSEGVCIGWHTFTIEGLYGYDCSIGNHAANGMVATVLVTSPPPPVITVMDIIAGSDDHTLLEAAILAAGLDDALNGEGPLTVFAPTDAAFEALATALGVTVTGLLASPNLSEILQHHVVAGLYMAADLPEGTILSSLIGDDLLFTIMEGTDMVHVNDAMVMVPDLTADNGVVHVIDAVLLPTISGIEEAEKGLALQLFPNPVSQDMVQLTGNWDAGSTLVVCDASGRLVFSQPMSSGTHAWNVEGLPAGMYSATVLSGLVRQTVSLIVQ